MTKRVLVTGAAGFIGFHLSRRLLDMGYTLVGLDNLNDYYSVQLKKDRLSQLEDSAAFSFHQLDLCDRAGLDQLFATEQFTHVVNLAAQAGVRYSLEVPEAYIQSNVVGFLNILENCRQHQINHLVYASTSSVYGLNSTKPYVENQTADHPMSLYGASKRANELMAHSYSHLYQLPCTGLRFFTVYGPWGRPDMATFLFADAISHGRPIDVYNHGKMQRSFTYVDDIVEGIVRVAQNPPTPDPNWSTDTPTPQSSSAPYRVYNIGNSASIELIHFIEVLEKHLGRKAKLNLMPIQPGDVLGTAADTTALERDVGYQPTTSIDTGLERFAQWFRDYYRL